MLMTLPYYVRKRWRALARVGTPKQWLEVHIFFGIVGPVLITLHTSFKFNGIDVGRLLADDDRLGVGVRRPVSLRPHPEDHPRRRAVVHAGRRAADAHAAGAESNRRCPPRFSASSSAFELAVSPARGRAPGAIDLFFGELRVRARLMLLRRHLRGSGVDVAAITAVVDRAAERATLARRLAHLQRTRHLFELWHVFHRPLVVGLFVIVALHVGIALYFGYASLG